MNKTILILISLTIVCILVMAAIDYFLGPRAEFLNAWSVIERLLGRSPSAGGSQVYRSYGAAGEFIAVLLANAAIAGVLTFVVRRWFIK